MSSSDKPGGKPGQRNKKAEQQRAKKPEQPQTPMPALQPDVHAQVETAAVSTEAAPAVAAAPAIAAAPAETLPIGLHTIATAYSDYTKKSLEETRCYVQRLAEVRSLDRALEVQTEFARQAYDTFLAESQKMRELYGKLARQTFKPLEGFVTKSTTTPR